MAVECAQLVSGSSDVAISRRLRLVAQTRELGRDEASL